jgi:two-component system, OmpR family, sensor kinase
VQIRTRSLRTRLVAMVLLLLALAATVIAVVDTLRLSDILYGKMDSDLHGALVFASGPKQAQSGRGGAPPIGRLGPDALSAVVAGGVVQSAGIQTGFDSNAATPIPPEYYPLLLSLPVDQGGGPEPDDKPHGTSVALGGFGTYRVLAGRSFNGNVVVVGQPESRTADTITQLVTTEIIVTIVALVGAGGLGLLLVRRELRPLERVAVTAKRVSALPLDRGEVSLAPRVPDVDPRTEVGQVGLALNRMLDHVGSALEARQESETQLRQFVADASHELRTPLAAIRGYAELTRRAQLNPEAEYSITRISSQAERMTTLVEDLLLLARLDAGRPLERSPVDLTRLVLDAVNDAHVAGPDHRWSLDLPEEPVSVTGDASRLTQVLTNLLANARTHTPPGTAVTVVLAATPDGAALSVVDDGPGIAPELLPHIFERFARGSTSRSREHGSTGLGLAIVSAVVAAHAGRVEVTSRPGRTEFRVLLPETAAAPVAELVSR